MNTLKSTKRIILDVYILHREYKFLYIHPTALNSHNITTAQHIISHQINNNESLSSRY
jgi:hypothetical protein